MAFDKDELLMMKFKVEDAPGFAGENAEYFDIYKKQLEKIGVDILLRDGFLSMWFDQKKFHEKAQRNAGSKPKINKDLSKKQDIFVNGTLIGEDAPVLRYSDIVYMMQTMEDKEIIEKTGMKHATFYRHKKAMKASYYFQSLNKDRLQDKHYLEIMPGNKLF